jgi:hypothetical protein
MTSGDRMDPSTHVPVVRCVWGGACGHVLSCQALNDVVSQGFGSGGACPVLKSPRAQLPGA